MRIRHLRLKAFGPFTDVDIDLSAGNHGLHIIQGPNEAGKSSALRAIGDLLYGIPTRSTDNFIHQHTKMWLGAELEHSDGSTLEFLRKKGNAKTLRAIDEQEVLPDEVLAPYLGTVDREMFLSSFGIDHEALRQGGQDIAKGAGNIGQLLFGAASGVAGLQDLQAGLRDEMNDLFRPSGSKPAINQAIRQLLDSRKAMRELQLSEKDWAAHDQSLSEAQQRKDELTKTIEQKSADRNGLTRILSALPAVAQWESTQTQLAEFADAPLLSREFADQRLSALIRLKKAEQQLADTEAKLSGLVEKLKEVSVPSELLAAAESVDGLRERLGAYRKSMVDQPRLITEREAAERLAKRILQDLGREENLGDVEKMHIPDDKRIRIRDLSIDQKELLTRLEAARTQRDRLAGRIEKANQKLAKLNNADDPVELQAAVQDILEHKEIETELEDKKSKLAADQESLTIRLDALPLGNITADQVEALPVPAEATIDRFESEFQEHQARCDANRQRHMECAENLADLTAQLDQLEREQDVPTEEDLKRARELRSLGWQLVSSSVVDETVVDGSHDGQVVGGSHDPAHPDEIRDFIQQFPPADSLTDAYQQSVAAADQIVDRIRREAERVGMKTRLQSEQERAQKRLDEIKQEQNSLATVETTLQTEWNQQWHPAGVEPQSPREMRSWWRTQQELAADAARLRELHRDIEELQETRNDAHATLTKLFPSSNTDTSNTSLQELLQLCQSQLQERQRSIKQTEKLQGELSTLQQEEQDVADDFIKAESDLAQWQVQWTAEMERLGLEDDATTNQANTVLTKLAELLDAYRQADELRVRIAGIDLDSQQFKTETESIAQQVGSELANDDPTVIVQALGQQLTEARTSSERFDSLTEQHAALTAAHEKAEQTQSDVEAELSAMCQQAKCEHHDQLEEALSRSLRQQELQRKSQELTDQLAAYSGGLELDEFVESAKSAADDADALQPRVDALEEEIEQLGQQRDEVLATIEREKNALQQMDGSAAAAEEEETCQALSSRLEEQMHQFAVLRIASAVLTTSIERYREQNQSPILNRASKLFRTLTLEAFSGLRADYNTDGKPILVGVRTESNEAIGVKAMSDGTMDQLYLALRLASLETWLQKHEPIPLIVDDILLNFDDQRAMIALATLAELSSMTQVIFFTHHEHLTQMAQQHISDDHLFVHRLSSGVRAEA